MDLWSVVDARSDKPSRLTAPQKAFAIYSAFLKPRKIPMT